MNGDKYPESVLVVIHTIDLEVLLLERADVAGFWQSVTGSKKHAGESLRHTAVREVAEETGITVGTVSVPDTALIDWHQGVEYDIYPIWRYRYPFNVTRNIEHWFSLTVSRAIRIIPAKREHIAYAWHPYREAAARCFSASNREAILQLPSAGKK